VVCTGADGTKHNYAREHQQENDGAPQNVIAFEYFS
jgi:hypothetical protein